MSTEEQFKNDIWWLIREIKKEHFVTPDDEYVSFEYTTSEKGGPTTEDQRRIIKYLVKLGAIKIRRDTFPNAFSFGVGSFYGIKPTGHIIEIVPVIFDSVYALFERGAKESIGAKKLFSMITSICNELKAEEKEEKKALPSPPSQTQSPQQNEQKDNRYQKLVEEVKKENEIKESSGEKPLAKLAWLDAVSEGNLKRFEKVIRITLEELEVTGINRLAYSKVSPEVYRREGLDAEEVKRILHKIGVEEGDIISVDNDEVRETIKGKEWMDKGQIENWKETVFKMRLLSDTDLDKLLLLKITTLDTVPILKQILDYIRKKLQKLDKKAPPQIKNTTSEQKLLFVLNRISDEYQIGTDQGWLEIPASEFQKSGADRSQLRRIMNQFKEKGLIEEVIFIDDDEGHNDEYLYDLYKLRLPPDYPIRADEFRISILDPQQYRQLKDLNDRVVDMRLNPEKYRKEGQERAQKRRERNEKMYSEINYRDPVEKRAWLQKWDIIQILWGIYTSSSKNMSISVLIEHLAQSKSQIEVEGILTGLKEEGCFYEWHKRKGNYDIFLINEEQFSDTYKRVKSVQEKYEKPDIYPTPESTISDEDIITVGSLKFNKITGDFTFNKVQGTLAPHTQEFKFLKGLLESKGHQCEYSILVKIIWDGKRVNEKASRNDLNTVVRNVKNKLGILPQGKSKNKNILKNIKQYGYRIIVK